MPTKRSQFIDFRAVKASVSMEQILAHYKLNDTFKRNGDSLSGPCPIHQGNNPTQFRVSISKNCWNCFSECKCGGNVLDFVAKMENTSIRDAAIKLAEWFNLSTTEPSREPRRIVLNPAAEATTGLERTRMRLNHKSRTGRTLRTHLFHLRARVGKSTRIYIWCGWNPSEPSGDSGKWIPVWLKG